MLSSDRDRIPAKFDLDPIRDIQILAPMNRGELGTQALNKRLQAVLVPHVPGQQVERFDTCFRVGDKVMQRQNDYTRELFNGDVGPLLRLDVIPLPTQHFEMLQRNLWYTAVTRGKQVVVIVGSRQALEMAVRNADTSRRYSQLTERLKDQLRVL